MIDNPHSMENNGEPERDVWSIAYRLMSVEGVVRQIEGGERRYTPADIYVEERFSKDGKRFWSKYLELSGGWWIGAHIHRERPEEGFGLYLRNEAMERSFSWNWFTSLDDGIYRQIQCGARARVEFLRLEGGSELRLVEFLDDTILTFKSDVRTDPRAHSHELIVRKDSVLRLS